jgi:hypothetical protein
MLREFFEQVCRYRRMARPVFLINATLFALLLLVFPFVEPGSSTYYVSLVSFGVIGVTLLAWGGLEYKCRQFERENAGVFGDDE